jgi:hypothetical protein
MDGVWDGVNERTKGVEPCELPVDSREIHHISQAGAVNGSVALSTPMPAAVQAGILAMVRAVKQDHSPV